MYGRALRFTILIPVFFLAASIVMAAGDEKDEQEPVAAREQDFNWVLGVCEPVVGDSSDPSLSLLSDGFMKRYLDLLTGAVGEMLRSPQEIAGIEQSRTDEALERVGKTIKAKIDERDQLLFKGYSAWKYRSLLTKAIASIDEQKELLEIERSRSYIVPERAALHFHATNEAGSLLAGPKAGEEQSFAEKNKLDAILLSNLREHYGYPVFSWKLYLRWEETVVMEGEVVFSRHSRDEAAEDAARRFIGRLTGTPLAVVVIRDVPPASHVEIDNIPVPLDTPFLLNAGRHRLTADSAGYHSLDVVFSLAGGESILMRPRMKSLELVETAIEVYGTDPEKEKKGDDSTRPLLDNVAVTLNNSYQGKTPLSLSVPAGEALVMGLSLPGYESRTILYESDGSARAQFVLPVIQKDKLSVKQARKGFYKAFGWFFLSVPLAMIATGIHESYSEALARTGDPVYSTGNVVSLISMGALWTGSAVLLGNTAWHLIYYLNASDDTGVDDYSQRGE